MKKLELFSSPILRIGLSLVFLWFGMNQIMDPSNWVGYIPKFVTDIAPFSVITIVYLNAIFEIIFATALFFGFFTRFTAFLLFLHIADITFTVGLDATGVRDFGLTIAMFVVWLNGSDFLTLDKFIVGSTKTISSDVS